MINHEEFKKIVLEKAKEKHRKVINDLRLRIQEMKGSEMILNEDQFDMSQQAIDEANSETISHLADEINFAEEEMIQLNKIQIGKADHDRVTIGCVVRTNEQVFFPSVSIEKFKVNHRELFGISTKAPFYKAMEGKRVGESFNFKGKEYRVLEVY